MTRATGTTETYSYDSLNRVTQVSALKAGGSTPEVRSYAYDTCTYGKGRPCTLTDPQGTLHYSYTRYGLLAQQTQTIADSHVFTTSWSYDIADQVSQVNYPGGTQVRYAWHAGNVASVDAKLGGLWQRVASFRYQPYGPANQILYGNGLAQTRTYDTDGRLTALSATGLQNLASDHRAIEEQPGHPQFRRAVRSVEQPGHPQFRRAVRSNRGRHENQR